MESNSPRDLFIFTHIPKTAGMTMYKLLDHEFSEDEIMHCSFTGHHEELQKLTQEAKDRLKLLRGHVPYGMHKYFPNRRCRYFTLMRNPIDRALSLYYYIKERPNHDWYDRVKNLNLIEFSEEFHDEISNLQSFYFTGKRNPAFKQTIQSLIKHYEFTGITEMFNESAMVLKFIFLWDNCVYTTVNRTKKRRRVDDLSEETIKRYEEINETDIKVYDWLSKKLQNEYNQILSKPIEVVR